MSRHKTSMIREKTIAVTYWFRHLFRMFFILLLISSQGVAIAAPTAQVAAVTMNFQDADIRQIIQFVSEMTGKVFVIDPRVKGQVTISTPSGLERSEAYEVFKSILRVHGFTINKIDGVHKVQPIAEARTEGGEVKKGRGLPGKDEHVVTQVAHLLNQDAATLAVLLKPLTHNWGTVAAYVPTNSLIIVDSAVTVRKIMEIVRVLDVSPKGTTHKLIPLIHASPAKVEKLLNSVYADFNGNLPKGKLGIKVFSDVRTSALLVVAPAGKIQEVTNLVSELDQRSSVSGDGNLHIYYPKNAKAEVISTALNELIGKLSGGKEQNQPVEFSSQVSVVHEESVNALLVAAAEKDYEMILPLIEGLDIRRMQVYVEALLVEMSASRAANLGVQWRTASGEVGLGVDLGQTNSSFGSLDQSNPLAAAAGKGFSIMATGSFGGASGLHALVQALESDGDTNIISTPHLITMDNEEAEILDGQNIPFKKGETSNSGGTTSSVDRKDVGIQLKMTPQILDDGRLVLQIYQEQSSVEDDTNPDGIVTNKRSIKTSVILNNGETVVLGGLVREETGQTINRVPCIGGATGIGEIFKTTSRDQSRRYMMVFIRPLIINTYEDFIKVTNEKYELLEGQWGQQSDAGSNWIKKIPAGSLTQFRFSGNESETATKPALIIKPQYIPD